jgi:hypothetical protein
MAVLAVWDKLVSGCSSLRTGKITGKPLVSGPFLQRHEAAISYIMLYLWASKELICPNGTGMDSPYQGIGVR